METRQIGMSVMKKVLSLDILNAGRYAITLKEVDGHEVYSAEFIFSQGINHITIPKTVAAGGYVTSVQGADLLQIQMIQIKENGE